MPDVQEIVRILEAVRRRPGMYFQPVDVGHAECFLDGLLVGCSAAGLPITWDVWRAAAERRGWKRRAAGPIPLMRDKGMTDEAIIDELIEIHIAAVRLSVEGERR